MKKVLMIGIDGADPVYLEKGMKEGKLPIFKKLADGGSFGNLKSTVPPLSIPAWQSIYTGKNPGKFGIYNFTELKQGSYEVDLVEWKVQGAIWDLLSKEGKKVAIVNNYFTYPPNEVNGIMISAIDNIEGNCYYPEELEKEIEEKVGKLDFGLIPEYFAIPREQLTKLTDEMLESSYKVVEYVLKNKKWDYFITTLDIDRIHHLYSDYSDILNWYSKIDELVERILKQVNLDNTLVILFSDHGGGKTEKSFFMNEFLNQEGLLCLSEERYKNKSRGILAKSGFNIENILGFIQKTKIDRLMVKFMPKKLWQWGKAKIPRKDIPFSEIKIDWLKTKAFAPSSSAGGIFVNLAGRQPYGIVKKENYEKVREEIVRKLKKLDVPIEIYKKEEIYDGDYLDIAPDVTFVMDDYKYFPKNSFSGEIFTEPMTPGHHRSNGFIMSNIKLNLKDAKVYDLFPTVLNNFGIKIPKDVDGKSLLAKS